MMNTSAPIALLRRAVAVNSSAVIRQVASPSRSSPSTAATAALRWNTPRPSFGQMSRRYNHDFSQLKASQERLMRSLHETCEWGKGERYGEGEHETGMSRLTLTDDDKKARDWFAETTRELGCKLTVDNMGNMFAVRPGKNKEAPPTMAGSHLDTQPTGGRYDGILGVHAGVEMLRVLHENNWETEGPVGVVNWTNEEGARFPKSMMSSGVWAGKIALEEAWAVQEVHPSQGGVRRTVKEELERIGYLGAPRCSHEEFPLGAHFELHIEQGPILEAEGLRIGVVRGGQAYRWYTVTLSGRDAHTGTTPMKLRKDPVIPFGLFVKVVRQTAKKRRGLASIGIITALPGSTNTIPHTLRFSLDVRHEENSKLMEMCERLQFRLQDCVGRKKDEGVVADWKVDTDSPSVKFDTGCLEVVRDAVKQHGDVNWKEMISGAGHDSCYTSWICPTAMIFVPCKEGKSHTPSEYCKPEDCTLGTQILMESILRYDAVRKQRGDFD